MVLFFVVGVWSRLKPYFLHRLMKFYDKIRRLGLMLTQKKNKIKIKMQVF